MSCDPHRDELILLLDPELAEDPERELSPEALGALQDHAQGCASCQDELIRLTLALAAASEEAAPALVAAAPVAGQVLAGPSGTPFGPPPSREEPVPARPGRYRRSARATALAEELSRGRVETSQEDAPRRLGDYEILAELGRGGLGIVYHARSSAGTEVALKVCLGLPQRLQERRGREFETLQRALATSETPRLAAPLETFVLDEGDERLWIEVMPLFRGPSLDDLLRSGRCDPQEATEIAVEIARALREAHSAGLLLRDLKPQDVFLEAEGLRVLVPDRPFDVSENRLTCTGAVLGTPYYLSPEQGQGKGVDERSDVFALGAIYHHLLTGAPPNSGAQTVHELFLARIEGDLPEPALPELSRDHKKVLARLLAADPERRYHDAEEALGDLLRVSEDLPIERQDPSWNQVVRLHPPLLETKASAITLAGLVAALAALVALAYFFLG
jgi:protein kinase-like protein